MYGREVGANDDPEGGSWQNAAKRSIDTIFYIAVGNDISSGSLQINEATASILLYNCNLNSYSADMELIRIPGLGPDPVRLRCTDLPLAPKERTLL